MIGSREEFVRILGRTAAELDGLAAREPAYPVWQNLRRQLHAMQSWTANGAAPTAAQLQRIDIGLMAARELEPPPDAAIGDLIDRLHQLNYYWRRLPTAPAATPTRSNRKALMIVLVAGGVVLLAIAGIAAIFSSRITVPSGTPISLAVRTHNTIATLIETLEPYRVSLNHRPEEERFKAGLFLRPVEGGSKGRLLPVAQGLRSTQFFGSRILGDDGRLLWFYVNEIGAVDWKTDKLVTMADLRAANPTLGDIWTDGKYQLDEHLLVTTRDYTRSYAVDAATLKASPIQGTLKNPPRDPKPEEYLASGGLLSPTEWFGVHSPAEVEREFRQGSSISRENRADPSASLRRIYQGSVDSTPQGPRVVSMMPVSGEEYLRGALLAGLDRQPLRLSGPDGFLLIYRKRDEKSSPFLGTLVVARVDRNGKAAWSVDTGVEELGQILPDARWPAFIGTRPQVEGKVSEPILAIVDVNAGTVSTTSLWQ